jgi:hypothetical protein
MQIQGREKLTSKINTAFVLIAVLAAAGSGDGVLRSRRAIGQ